MAKKQNNDTIFWVAAVLLIFIGLSPIGVGMILWKLFLEPRRSKSNVTTPAKEPLGARTTTGVQIRAQMEQSAQREERLRPLSKRANHRIRVGSVLSGLFGLSLVLSLPDALSYLPHAPLDFWNEILVSLCCLIGSGSYLLSGLLQRNQLRRFRTYLSMIGTQPHISIAALEAATKESAKKIRSDLSDLLDLGMFSGGYLNHGTNQLIVFGNGVTEPPVQPTPSSTSQISEPSETQNELLLELRSLHDTIQNRNMAKQIDRIGILTAQILQYQAAHPEKAAQLNRFSSYYLPTTLKILRTYVKLEQQETRGENISSAMRRIEGMMDTVGKGFETQLDQLFLGDSMDIASEVTVLEQMLAKDGLSGSGITLEL